MFFSCHFGNNLKQGISLNPHNAALSYNMQRQPPHYGLSMAKKITKSLCAIKYFLLNLMLNFYKNLKLWNYHSQNLGK